MTQNRDWIDLLERREREAEALESLAPTPDAGGSSDVGTSLARARRESGLSLEDLAARVGCSAHQLRRLEESPIEGHSLPMLQRIADALAMDLSVGFTPRRSVAASSLELPSA